MSDQKDIQKTSINIYEKSDVSDKKSLQNGPLSTDGEAIYDFANKKTEKLVTALYMVTDCMDTEDALKNKLRLLGVELLSDMYKLTTLSPMDKHVQIPISLTHIKEVLSFIEISYTIGFISEMNTMILKKEFNDLVDQLESYRSKDKHFTFTLDEKMFEFQDDNVLNKNEDYNYKGHSYIKDKSIGQTNKRTPYNTMPARPIGVSFTNGDIEKYQVKKINSPHSNLLEREERKNKILTLVKDLPIGQSDASIKDISLAFADCSEKTIQREINALVLSGKLVKTGAKRWSRYALVESSK